MRWLKMIGKPRLQGDFLLGCSFVVPFSDGWDSPILQ